MGAEDSLAQQWEAHSSAWARWCRTPEHDVHFLRYNWPAFHELLPAPGRATLDLGCGEGRAGAELTSHTLTGLDASPTLAALAAERGVYEQVVVGDAAALPFGDGAFDLVAAFMSLQDMDDAAGAVAEAARVLEPGGRLVAAFVHPIASARLTRPPDEQRPYFGEQRTVDPFERDGLTFTFHQLHRSLEAWLALFLGAGLTLEALREPRPSAAGVQAAPVLSKGRDRPQFLHVRCRK